MRFSTTSNPFSSADDADFFKSFKQPNAVPTTIPLPGKGGDNDNWDDMTQRILTNARFTNLVASIKQGGSQGLSPSQKTAIVELSRLSEAHSSPTVRKALAKACEQIKKAHLDFCFSLKSVKS
jgi:hypothetical protein